VNGLESSDPALTPASGVPLVKDEKEYQTLDPEVAVGRLIKKQTPFYPMIAKSSGQQGNVILAAAIGTDGKIHNLEVVYAPSASLAAAAKDAVSQWEYSPYLVNGKPIEVETTVNVTFTMRF
jgi:protein TonB